MNGFQLKMIVKNQKPLLWKRLYVPGGITFTQLSFILNEMFALPQDRAFGFEFFGCKVQISEPGRYFFNRGKGEYDQLNADTLYIDDFLGTQPWFSYFRMIDGREAAYRVEIEDCIINATAAAPELVKTVTLESEDEAYLYRLNDRLKKAYAVRYVPKAPCPSYEETAEQLGRGSGLTGSLHPVNAPLGESNEIETILSGRIMEKKAWIQRCDYAVSKWYGTCRADEFCKLCRTAADLNLEDGEIEALFDEIPEDEHFCTRQGNRYIDNGLIESSSCERMLKWHHGKRIWYPQSEEIDDLWEHGYPASDPAYAMARTSMIRDIRLESADADKYLRIIFDEFSYAAQISHLLPKLEKDGLKLKDKESAETMMALLVILNNNTRMAIHKGNSLADLPAPQGAPSASAGRQPLFGGGPGGSTGFGGGPGGTSLTGSTGFGIGSGGSSLREAGSTGMSEAKLAAVKQAGQIKAAPKIYPNDPCPCGSGKKYKKCCGRGK